MFVEEEDGVLLTGVAAGVGGPPVVGGWYGTETGTAGSVMLQQAARGVLGVLLAGCRVLDLCEGGHGAVGEGGAVHQVGALVPAVARVHGEVVAEALNGGRGAQ
ncbi:hypothetical protein [Streptomyces sp. NPDC088925]|uniref:hypothetical protein n=1 Tax=Streptomyces sp. NPDC088925 TaxID=3365914 RepID=UPI0037F645A7